MSRIDVTALIVSIIAVILLIVSGILIVQQGIPALQNVAAPVTSSAPISATRVPVVASPLPDTGVAVVNTAVPVGGGFVTPTSVALAGFVEGGFVTVTPPGEFFVMPPTLAPIACLNPISGDDRLLFDTSNGSLTSATSHRFNFDLTFAAEIPGAGSGSLTLSGDGFSQTLTDGSIELQADATWRVTVTEPGQPTRGVVIESPVRFNSSDVFFRIVVPDQGNETPWFVIGFEDMLNDATGGAFLEGLPIDPGSLDPSSLIGLDISVLDEATGFFDLFNFDRFICTERLADTGGQAHYISSVDILAFLQSSDFAGTLDSLLALMGTGEPGMGEGVVASMPILINQLVSELQINVDTYVNVTDRNTASVTLDVNTGFNIPVEDGSILPLMFDVTGSIQYSDYNRPQTLDLPTDPIRIQDIEEINAYLTPGS